MASPPDDNDDDNAEDNLPPAASRGPAGSTAPPVGVPEPAKKPPTASTAAKTSSAADRFDRVDERLKLVVKAQEATGSQLEEMKASLKSEGDDLRGKMDALAQSVPKGRGLIGSMLAVGVGGLTVAVALGVFCLLAGIFKPATPSADAKSSSNVVLPEEQLKQLRDIAKQAGLSAEEKEKLAGAFASKLNDAVQAHLAQNPTKPGKPPTPSDPPAFEALANTAAAKAVAAERAKELDTLKAQVASLTKQIADSAGTNAVAAERAKELEALKAQVETLKKQLADSAKPKAAGETEDLVIVALHSKEFDFAAHKGAFLRALAALPRSKDGPFRVGLALGQTDVVKSLVDLDAPEAVREDRLEVGDPAGQVEKPSAFGQKLVETMYRNDRPNRAALLVASTDCKPLVPDAPGWSVLSRVNVLLVQGDKPLDPARRDEWGRFCDQRNGCLSVLPPKGELARRLVLLAQPQLYPPRN